MTLNLKEAPPDDGIPDPEENTAGWKAPVPIDEEPNPYLFFQPRAAMDAEGILYLAWTRADASLGSIVVQSRTLDTGTDTWSEVRQNSEGLFLDDNLPTLQGISGEGGSALIWTWRRLHEIDASYEALGLVYDPDEDALIPVAPDGLEPSTQETTFAGSLLPGQRPLLLRVGNDGYAYQSLDGQAYTKLFEQGGLADFAEIYALEDGRLAVKHYQGGSTPMLYLYNPDEPTGGTMVDIQATYSAMFDMHGTADPHDTVHAKTGCGAAHAICYGNYSALTGAIGVQGEVVTDDENLVSRSQGFEMVMGADDSVWALLTIQTDDAVSLPVLFQRLGAEAWSDPLFPGYARGEVAAAIDPDGRMHLIYVAPAGETGRTEVYYTAME